MTNLFQQSQNVISDPLITQAGVSNFATQSFGATTQGLDAQLYGATGASQAFDASGFGVTNASALGATGLQQSYAATGQVFDATNASALGATGFQQSFGTGASFDATGASALGTAGLEQYGVSASQSLQQQFGPMTTSVQDLGGQYQVGVTQSVPLQGQVDFATSQLSTLGTAQSTPIPQVYPKVTQTTVAKKQTITAPVKRLGASTVRGPSTSKTLPITYSRPVTTSGKVLPPIHSPPKVSQLPPQQTLGESRPPIYIKQVFKKSEINVNVPKSTQRLPEQHKNSEVQGGVLAPINQQPMMLQPSQGVPITRPPQYDKASVKVVDVPINGGILPQRFLNPRQLKPNYTNIPAAQKITRNPVMLKENVVNVAPLPAKWFPPRMLGAKDMGYSKSVDNIFASSAMSSYGTTAVQPLGLQGGFTTLGATTAQPLGLQGLDVTGTAIGGDLLGAQGFSTTGVTSVQGADLLGATQGLGVTGTMGGDLLTSGVTQVGAGDAYGFSSGYQQSGATQYQSSSSYQVGPTTSYQQYFQTSSSSVSPVVTTGY